MRQTLQDGSFGQVVDYVMACLEAGQEAVRENATWASLRRRSDLWHVEMRQRSVRDAEMSWDRAVKDIEIDG